MIDILVFSLCGVALAYSMKKPIVVVLVSISVVLYSVSIFFESKNLFIDSFKSLLFYQLVPLLLSFTIFYFISSSLRK
jgi:hypothetical protein